jgi:hypothetical protein
MATRLVSVNIGLPRDINWRGKTVHTGIWKSPVPGRVIVRKLNIDGDGQGISRCNRARSKWCYSARVLEQLRCWRCCIR